MIYEIWPNGAVSKNWEWIGANGTDDGGTWEWNKTIDGRVSVSMNSNTHKLIVARLYAERWNGGTFPPPGPWFVASSPYEWNNLLEYYGPQANRRLSAVWQPQ